MKTRDERRSEDFKFMILCHAKGNPAMYELLRDRSLDAPDSPKVGHVIEFTPEGEVQAMHNDKFDLGFLGNQSIRRATEIKFNDGTQRWDICLPIYHEGPTLPPVWIRPMKDAGSFASYEGARQVEVAWLNSCRRDGLEPTSEAGLETLRQLRKAMNL